MKKQVYKQDIWNLKDLLKTHKGPEFENLLKLIDGDVKKFEKYREQLNPNISAEKVIEIIKFSERIEVQLSKIGSYSYMLFSINTKSQEARTFKDRVTQHFAELGNRMMFFSLWFKKLDEINAQRII